MDCYEDIQNDKYAKEEDEQQKRTWQSDKNKRKLLNFGNDEYVLRRKRVKLENENKKMGYEIAPYIMMENKNICNMVKDRKRWKQKSKPIILEKIGSDKIPFYALRKSTHFRDYGEVASVLFHSIWRYEDGSIKNSCIHLNSPSSGYFRLTPYVGEEDRIGSLNLGFGQGLRIKYGFLSDIFGRRSLQIDDESEVDPIRLKKVSFTSILIHDKNYNLVNDFKDFKSLNGHPDNAYRYPVIILFLSFFFSFKIC